jgi:hypothetical protein
MSELVNFGQIVNYSLIHSFTHSKLSYYSLIQNRASIQSSPGDPVTHSKFLKNAASKLLQLLEGRSSRPGL